MRVKKLGLGLSAVASLAIPVLSTATFKVRAAGALDGDLVALDLEQGTSPFLVTPRCLALEDDLIFLISIGFGLEHKTASYMGVVFQVREVQGSPRRDSDAREHNSGAGRLRLARGGISRRAGERAARRSLVEGSVRGSSNQRRSHGFSYRRSCRNRREGEH